MSSCGLPLKQLNAWDSTVVREVGYYLPLRGHSEQVTSYCVTGVCFCLSQASHFKQRRPTEWNQLLNVCAANWICRLLTLGGTCLSLPNWLNKRVQRRRHTLVWPACEREREERRKKSLHPSPSHTIGPGRHNSAGSSVRFLRLSQRGHVITLMWFFIMPYIWQGPLWLGLHTHTHAYTHTEQRFVLLLHFLNQFIASFVFSKHIDTLVWRKHSRVTFTVLSDSLTSQQAQCGASAEGSASMRSDHSVRDVADGALVLALCESERETLQ